MNHNKLIFKHLFLILFVVIVVVGCKPESFVKQSVMLNLTNWNLPDTVKVTVDFDLFLSTETTSSCEKNTKFVITQIADDAYKVYGAATYVSFNSECYSEIIKTDSTFEGNISKVGRYYFLFLKDELWNVDSIQVVP